MDRGRTYLIYEKQMARTAHIAHELSKTGSSVLTVTRLHPDLIEERMPLCASASIWLSERAGSKNVPPDQLNRLYHQISTFLSSNKDGVVLLEGVEYLLLFNETKKVLSFVERVNDLIMSSHAVLLVPIDPPTLTPRTLAYLRRSAEIVP